MKQIKPTLFVELVPKTCHFSNVRTMVTTKQWNTLRFQSYELAGNKCEICKGIGTKQGFKHNLECHEIWEYNDTEYIQKLIGLISLCPICHQVKHIGRSIAIGKLNSCIKQLAKVNNWTPEQIAKHISDSFEVYHERSKHKWILDISLLTKEPYNLNLDLTAKRIFEVKKYKKKKKKKTGIKKRPPKK